MPLLDMIGVDACQRSFCIAFAFLSGETEGDFLWALDRLRSLYEHHCHRLPSVILTDRCIACMNAVAISFPTSYSLLCLWHANKAVLRYCQPAFVRQDQSDSVDPATNDTLGVNKWVEFYQFWHSIMGAPNEEAFKDRVMQFEKRYLPEYLKQVGYIKTFWLEQYQEKLVKAWVDQHAHFGNTATSRVEGIHALMKSHLKKSTLDLFEAWRAIKHALLNQLSELRSNQARQQIRTPIELSGPLYDSVRGWVSHEALRKVEEQRKLLGRRDPPPSLICTGSFTKSHGLPCLHTLKSLQEQGKALTLEHFHSHWHLQRNGAPQLLLEPRQRVEPMLKDSNIPKQSTRREPSAFESVEMVPKAPPTCSRCHAVGHTRAAKSCPMRFQELLQEEALASEPQPQSVLAQSANPELQLIPSLADAVREQSEPEQGDLSLAVAPGVSAVSSAVPCFPLAQSSPTAVELPTVNDSRCQMVRPNSPTSNLQLSGSPVGEAPRLPNPQPPMPPKYDNPQAIYERYVAARSAWYATQAAGSIKTNQQYRRAMGLPLRYDKKSYEWCLDYKQMSRRLTTSSGSREWTKEEMMAYLDWSKAEDERIEAQVAMEMRTNPSTRRGVTEIWKSIETDSRQQDALHSASISVEDCIVVKG
ncbi:hypothetical protein MGU_11634 [Metarhizium guizhouense ARSEF 977]|uniref:MULE transposase domain-containing protein n=1 Tax=Metarhizium guizhouense (strain ARSEF 977) TaxID=1276136 RepID=A0A0B4GET3_METGA|nr:hypothetical protein MGU_11634 [Metarhizium guizhouense ARSEF 977]